VNNVPQDGDPTQGQIGTSHWDGTALYILGQEDVDTDEFDTHITVHEWGHYFESKLGRSDNPGGTHTFGDLKDPRLAFGEGWGNGLSAIVLYPDTTYTDTSGPGEASGFAYDLQDNTALDPNPGWYSESSVGHILVDVFDNDTNESFDTVALGLGPIYDVMVGGQKNTSALTTIFSFIHELKVQQNDPTLDTALDALLAEHQISSVADDFGTGETNNGGNAAFLPVYNQVDLNGASPVTFTLSPDQYQNSLGDNRYFVFAGNNADVSVSLTCPNADFHVELYQGGVDQLGVDCVQATGSVSTSLGSTVSGTLYVLVATGGIAGADFTSTLNLTSP
jgi:hypothetical protein